MTIAACLVTRGDVDLSPIREQLARAGFVDRDIVVWDNGDPARDDRAVYGRYAAIRETDADLIYVQDDDCVLMYGAILELIHLHEAGKVVCNMPGQFRHDFYRQHALVGFGAVFERDLPHAAFRRCCWGGIATEGDYYDADAKAIFDRTCDVIFTTLTPYARADVPYRNLPWAEAPNRMYRDRNHVAERARVHRIACKARDLPMYADGQIIG